MTGTTDSSGSWSTSLSVSQVTGLGEGSITLTATADDAAGNEGTGTRTISYDPTEPTISSAAFEADGAVTLTMSEDVWAGSAPTATDFKVKSGAAGNLSENVVTNITGLANTKAGADTSFALSVTTALVAGNTVKVYYTKGTNAVSDEAGNELASVAENDAVDAAESVVKTLSVSKVAGDDVVNAAEDNAAVLIAGTSTGLGSGTAVTVALDDSDSGTDANESFSVTTTTGGAWTTAATDLTATKMQGLTEGTVTITASSAGATSGTRTITYDATAPTVGTNTITSDNTDTTIAMLGDTVSVSIDFDEEVDEDQTTVKYQIGSGTEREFSMPLTVAAESTASYDRSPWESGGYPGGDGYRARVEHEQL